ncbi:MAG TPA: TonB family protein [Vicinamibacterales bacterium]|nr:TonB family protein [Vicinamibacterales bacterium]
MPRDLFAGTFERKAAPRRSGWTIAGSFVAHAVLLGALLVLPVMSALDSYVVQARTIAFVVPPPPVMPAVPVAPPKSSTPAPSDIKNNAAPLQPPLNEVTKDATTVPSGPVPPGAMVGDGRDVILGPPGSGVNVQYVAPPPMTPPQPIRPGGNVSTPTRLLYVDPIYPQIAIISKTQGTVILEATIDETGVVRDVKVLRSIALLDQPAIDAVKRWRYTPTKLNGVAVPILLTVTVTFSLR